MTNGPEELSETGPSYEQLHTLVADLLEQHGKPTSQRYAGHIERSARYKIGRALVRKLTNQPRVPFEDTIGGELAGVKVELPFVRHKDTTYAEGAMLTSIEGLPGQFDPKIKYTHGSTYANPHPLSDHSAIATREHCDVELPLSPVGYDPAKYRTLFSYLQTMGTYLNEHPDAAFPFSDYPSEQADWIEDQERQIMAEYQGQA